MSVWDTYKSRIDAHGGNRRNATLLRESRMLKLNVPDSLSYHSVDIDDVRQNVAIIDSDNLNEKYIYSLPGEDVKHGGLVYWKDNYWLITERDANDTVYVRGKMIQCNHLLRWVDEDRILREQWCIIEDGTKYLTGEYEDRNFVVTRGDSRIAMTIARNDDPDSPHKLAYLLTKPLKLGLTYNNNGVFKFVLQEVTATDNDNHVLGIADYYKYFPREPLKPEAPDKGGGWL